MVVLTGGRDGGGLSVQIRRWTRTSGAQDGQTVLLDGGELHKALLYGVEVAHAKERGGALGGR
jgi:hypothetical protein